MPELSGIDVSSWQGQIDWGKVKENGVDFAILRVAYGTRIDKTFNRNILEAQKAQIPCGVYLYSTANTVAQALNEAKFTLQTIKPYKLDFPVTFDIEDNIQMQLSNTVRTDLIDAFCSTIAESGYRAMVYSSLSWFQYMFQLERLKNYDFWIAQWDVKQCTFSGETHIWQYTAKGKVEGIKGDVDRNIAYKEYPVKAPATKPPIIVTPSKRPPLQAGEQIYLSKVSLYETSADSVKNKVISGNYWLYDGKVINGKVRITNKKENANKKPIVNYVTGYIKITDVKPVK